MSISEEKMMILKMLQEGKINSEEAAKLLEALDGAGKSAEAESKGTPRYTKSQANYYDEIAKFRERIHEWKNEFSKNYNEKDFEKMVDEFTDKAEKFGKNVANTTFGFVDKIADYVGSVIDTGSFSIFGSANAIEKEFEAAAYEGMDIYIQGVNGHILIKKHDENTVKIKSKIRGTSNYKEDMLLFSAGEKELSLRLAWSDYISVSHEISVPAVQFNKIRLETKNAKIYVEDAISNSFEAYTKNSAIDLTGIKADMITAETKNAKITANYITGRHIALNTKNSFIEVKNVKTAKLGAATSNSRISVENILGLEGVNETILELRTRNAGIKANFNDLETTATGYKVTAAATNGGVNLLIPNLQYSSQTKQYGRDRFTEARTADFEAAQQRFTVFAETHNGYIEIVK